MQYIGIAKCGLGTRARPKLNEVTRQRISMFAGQSFRERAAHHLSTHSERTDYINGTKTRGPEKHVADNVDSKRSIAYRSLGASPVFAAIEMRTGLPSPASVTVTSICSDRLATAA